MKYSNNGVSYDSDTAYNEAYNGTEWTANKPGNQYVLANYGEAADVTNVYIVKSEDILMDGGKVLPRLAQAMYGRITDMDNLNKRLGEARFIDQEDGLWVRLRYDRMGKDDQFRLRGKTAELGYDWKKNPEETNSKRGTYHRGVSFKYTWDDVTFGDLASRDSEMKTWSLGAYDTFLGNDGFYHDYILRAGRSKADYSVGVDNVSGSADATFIQAGAEIGKKYDGNKGWFFEPQAQLQYTRINGAKFSDSNDTRAELDSVNSLISRLGIRVGREFGGNDRHQMYGYVNVLHEFMGETGVFAYDNSGAFRSEKTNKGTWMTVGLGGSTQLNDQTSVFIDFEKAIGNDFEQTYRFNARVQYKF